jgi:hypothetical protein
VGIEFDEFRYSSLPSIEIPRNVTIICLECFSDCKFLESVLFESNSRLTRIESDGFVQFSLQSIDIPRGVRFITGDAFEDVKFLPILIESGNERFVIREDLLIDIVDYKLIRKLSSSPSVRIPSGIDIFRSPFRALHAQSRLI